MNDLISRQAAIDLFPNDALEWDTIGGYIAPHLARRMIEELPSSQPEIIRCKDCKWYGTSGCALWIVDETDYPQDDDYCSFGERKDDE